MPTCSSHGSSAARAALVALGLLGAVACDGGSSPTAPDASPVTVSIVFDDPNGALTAHAPLIRQLIEAAFDRASQQIPVGGTTFTITPERFRTVPGWGIGGYTLGPASIDIPIDPGYPGLEIALFDRLPHIAAHELHHAARLRGASPGSTLFEALIMEGLADHFALELVGGPLPPWSNALSPDEIGRYLLLAEPEFDDLNDYDRWFFGFHPGIPRWTGYTLGFHLVGNYIARSGQSAAELVHTPADRFRPV